MILIFLELINSYIIICISHACVRIIVSNIKFLYIYSNDYQLNIIIVQWYFIFIQWIYSISLFSIKKYHVQY